MDPNDPARFLVVDGSGVDRLILEDLITRILPLPMKPVLLGLPYPTS